MSGATNITQNNLASDTAYVPVPPSVATTPPVFKNVITLSAADQTLDLTTMSGALLIAPTSASVNYTLPAVSNTGATFTIFRKVVGAGFAITITAPDLLSIVGAFINYTNASPALGGRLLKTGATTAVSPNGQLAGSSMTFISDGTHWLSSGLAVGVAFT